MPYAIQTKYLPYTKTMPSRIKASIPTGQSLIMTKESIPGNIDDQHHYVAQKLSDELGWGPVVSGSLNGIDVHVRVPEFKQQNTVLRNFVMRMKCECIGPSPSAKDGTKCDRCLALDGGI